MTTPRSILESATTIAVVGLSTNPDKAAHAVPTQLQRYGFRVIPVHPSADEILGERVYRRLEDIPETIDVVEVFRPADEAPGIARQAVAAGAGALWLQQGIRSDEAGRIAKEAGIGYVEDHCMAVERALHGIDRR